MHSDAVACPLVLFHDMVSIQVEFEEDTLSLSWIVEQWLIIALPFNSIFNNINLYINSYFKYMKYKYFNRKCKRAVIKYIKDIKLVEWEPVYCSKIYSDTEEFSKNLSKFFDILLKVFVHAIFFEWQKITVQRVSSRIARVSSRVPRNRHNPKFPKIYKIESKTF